MNKKIIFPVIALAVLGYAILDVNLASADETNNPKSTIVEKIAEEFGLNQDDVQQVFDEVRSERQAEMKAIEDQRLNQLISDGKITKEQKALIQTKQEELRAERESIKNSFKDLGREERQAQMESKKTELETWASENGLDAAYLMPNAGEREHGGPGGPMMHEVDN